MTVEEALKVLREAAAAGLVHSSGNCRRGMHYICNCCICCCGVLHGISEFGIRNAVARSSLRSTVDAERGCPSWEAKHGSTPIDVPAADSAFRFARRKRFVSSEARKPRRRSPPATLVHRMHERAAARGITMDDITWKPRR